MALCNDLEDPQAERMRKRVSWDTISAVVSSMAEAKGYLHTHGTTFSLEIAEKLEAALKLLLESPWEDDRK